MRERIYRTTTPREVDYMDVYPANYTLVEYYGADGKRTTNPTLPTPQKYQVTGLTRKYHYNNGYLIKPVTGDILQKNEIVTGVLTRDLPYRKYSNTANKYADFIKLSDGKYLLASETIAPLPTPKHKFSGIDGGGDNKIMGIPKTYFWVGIGAIALVGGFFAYRKFVKK